MVRRNKPFKAIVEESVSEITQGLNMEEIELLKQRRNSSASKYSSELEKAVQSVLQIENEDGIRAIDEIAYLTVKGIKKRAEVDSNEALTLKRLAGEDKAKVEFSGENLNEVIKKVIDENEM